MKKYMGYPFNEGRSAQNEQPRQLPECEIEGTSFYVDIKHHELRQVDNQANRIGLGNTKEDYGFHHFLYDTRIKSFYLGSVGEGTPIPMHVRMVLVPPLRKLDPVGLALRQGFNPEYYGGASGRVKLMTMAVEPQKRRSAAQKKGRRIG